MDLLISFVLKSFLVAGVALGLLRLLRDRSASERNLVAHCGLLALLVLPVGSMILPQLVVQQPVLAAAQPALSPAAGEAAAPLAATASTGPVAAAAAEPAFSALDLWPLLYGLPAAALLIVLILAVLRLLALRAKASVLVEPTWLTALAHAQRRMDFKHGTALLTSRELHSPISWGVLRPIILLNEEALEATGEAEAIIAHELAHVRGLDWAKLLLARIVTAIFWFNPLAWMLAREAHQLREETADDAVLASDVPGTDYAQLLVGVARHDCKGLLLGAHGVAPSKSSLARRVRRVLDSSLPRTPAARSFAAGMALGVVGTAAPLAALTFTPPKAAEPTKPYYVSAPAPARSLPSVVAQSVAGAAAVTSEAVATQVSAAITGQAAPSPDFEKKLRAQIEEQVASLDDLPLPPKAPKAPRPPRTATEREFDKAFGRAVAAKSLGVTPQFAAEMRAAAPNLDIDDDDILALKAVGATPQWVNGMLRSGYRVSDIDDLTGARAVGVDGNYIAELAGVGFRNISLDNLTAMRALGITAGWIRGLKATGVTGLTPDKLIELKAQNISAEALRYPGVRAPRLHGRVRPPEPPEAPEPPDDPDPGSDQ